MLSKLRESEISNMLNSKNSSCDRASIISMDGANLKTDCVKESNLNGPNKNAIFNTIKINSFQRISKPTKFNINRPQKKTWTFLSFISTILVVRKFLLNLKNLSFLRSDSELSQKQKELIGDKVYIQINENEEGFLTKWLSFFEQQKIVLDPNKRISIFLDFLTLLALVFYFMIIPLELAFKILSNDMLLKKLNAISLTILFLDILRKFVTAFYLKGQLIYSFSKICVHYMKNSFCLDFLTLVPILLQKFKNEEKTGIFSQYYDDYLLFIFYLKIRRFGKIFARLEELLLTNINFHHLISLLKLIFRIIFISHIFACLWIYMGTIGDQYFGSSWMAEKKIMHSNFFQKYLFSYYFVCVTMNTVGFGDVIPMNSLEMGFCIIFIFFACGMFAYNINSIGIILSDISKESDEYEKDLNTINHFMKKKYISFELQMRIRKYLEYIRKKEIFEYNEATMITLDKLSDTLKEELLLEANGSILKEIKMLSCNFSEESLRKMVMIMKEKRYSPGEVIFEKGDFQDNHLYIIKNGEVELLFGNSANLKAIHLCRKGDTIGEFSFFSGKEQSFAARSLDFTSTFSINKDDFLSILKNNPKDYERFNEIKDRLLFNDDTTPFYSKCFSCFNSEHIIEKCPLLHYCPKNQIIIDKHLFNYFQERKYKFNRKREKNKKSITVWKENAIIALKIQENCNNYSIKEIEEDSDDFEELTERENENTDKEFNTEDSETFIVTFK